MVLFSFVLSVARLRADRATQRKLNQWSAQFYNANHA